MHGLWELKASSGLKSVRAYDSVGATPADIADCADLYNTHRPNSRIPDVAPSGTCRGELAKNWTGKKTPEFRGNDNLDHLKFPKVSNDETSNEYDRRGIPARRFVLRRASSEVRRMDKAQGIRTHKHIYRPCGSGRQSK